MKRFALLFLILAGMVHAQTGTLEIAVDSSPAGLDPHKVTAFSSFAVIGQIYDGLFELNSDLQMEPALATGYEVSDDGLTYTVAIREGVKFHNGRDLTAADVVWSLERILDPETGSPQASRFAEVESATAADDFTVVITLSMPFAPFGSNLGNLTVVPREVVEANGDLQQVAVGTGPFKLVEVVPDTYLRLEANTDYYRPGEPGVAELRYNIVPESSTRAAGLRNGTYHLLPTVDPAAAEVLQTARNITLLGKQDLSYTLLGLNVEREPFNDPLVRQAINYAIDREEIVDAVHFGNGVPGGPLSPALVDWASPVSDFPCYAHDADKARSLLAEAGHADGISFEILTFGTMKVVLDTAQVLQAQLARAGINAEVNVAEFGTFVQDWSNSNFDAFVSLNGGSIDPDGYLHRTFITDGSTNVFKYSDSRVDELLQAGRTTTGMAERQEIYQELQQRLACEGPVAHVVYGTLFTAFGDNVEGFEQIASGGLRYIRNITLK
jgi:peptide/nickel transport system substrate-binding protein